ncbi:uncharacterized protein LOC130293566 [Hyla sarda]|uniref:uncharacterized protein LOC130293566 n=1 Tax=Hyla sarda TaxID=327740 RepID=UPI0024C45647|nr:uncharacterized protein LOC130293566 [Hyla sarda]
MRGVICQRSETRGTEVTEKMENARERSSEREVLSSSQDVFIREISSSDNPAASPDDSAKQKERKPQAPPRSSIVPTSHHRSSHPVDRHGQSSSTSGALDLQSLVGRSGSSSSLSGISVPIRLDALSYLLNNAVLGAYKTPSQMPSYPLMYPCCPFPQMGYPYSPCMGSPPYNMPYMNPACQPGLMPCGTQQGVQACQNPMPNFNQFAMGTTPSQNQSLFSGITPQMGAPFTTSTINMTPSGQDNRGMSQSDSNTWAQKANQGFGNKVNLFSSNYEKQSSPPQRGFPRFGDKQSEENWSNRGQNSSNRGFGRGRGDFGGRSWQSNFSGQERRFGERSWNSDSGGRRRFQESPDRSQDRGSSFKRGRWQDGRGRGGDNRDSWQQRNRQSFSPRSNVGTFQDRFKSRQEEEKVVTKTDDSNDKDEDWEMDYVGEPTACETPSTSLPPTSKTCESPQTIETAEKSVNRDEDVSVGGSTTNLHLEKEEEELDSDRTNQETTEIEAQEQDMDQAPGPVDESAEKTIEDGEERRKEDVDEEDNKEILVSVDAEDK